MKNMKKLAVFGLAAVMSLSLLSACSGGNEPAETTAPESTAPMEESTAPTGPAAWTSAADLEGAKIAVQEGTTGEGVATAIAGTTVSSFKAATECAMELVNGRVDCVVIDTNPAKSLVEANPDKLMMLDFPASEEQETYAIATPKTDEGAALVEELNAAMAELKDNGTFDLLVQKYISKEEVELPELPAVTESKGTLVMGTNAEFEPFEYVASDGSLTGFDIDYAKYLCATMGYELTIENMDFDALIPALQTEKVDFVAAGMSATEERMQNANFTDGYYEAVQSIVVLKPEA